MDVAAGTPPTLAAISNLRAEQATAMTRTMSQDIREEREELREAAEQTLNALVDLKFDGTIISVSPSWTDVVGTHAESVTGVPISDLIVSEGKTIFTDVIGNMRSDDSKSHRVRFTIRLGPLSKLRSLENIANDLVSNTQEDCQEVAELEAQGIMVYDSASGEESHVGFYRPISAVQDGSFLGTDKLASC